MQLKRYKGNIRLWIFLSALFFVASLWIPFIDAYDHFFSPVEFLRWLEHHRTLYRTTLPKMHEQDFTRPYFGLLFWTLLGAIASVALAWILQSVIVVLRSAVLKISE